LKHVEPKSFLFEFLHLSLQIYTSSDRYPT